MPRQPWQCASLGNRDVGLRARFANPLHHQVGPERARRQVDHLPVLQMRGELRGNILLRKGRRWRNDQLRSLERCSKIVGRHDRDLPAALVVGQGDAACLLDIGETGAVAPPPADIMARLGEIRRSRIRPVASAQNRYFHSYTPLIAAHFLADGCSIFEQARPPSPRFPRQPPAPRAVSPERSPWPESSARRHRDTPFRAPSDRRGNLQHWSHTR